MYVYDMQVFTLCIDDVLDETTLRRVLASGHSRVPVHRAGNRYIAPHMPDRCG